MEKASMRKFPMEGRCNPEAVVLAGQCRFTLITERILRIEYDPEGMFENRPSQAVLNRKFPVPAFTVKDSGGRLEIDTKLYHLSFEYGVSPVPTENTLKIDAKNGYTNYGGTWRWRQETYGDPPRHDNLMGTARTLDRVNGSTEVSFGLMNRAGRSWFDDSRTALIDADGSLHSRRPGTEDVYYVSCGHAYEETLRHFYRISGLPPMLPRYALGNWWSRWWEYSEESYNALMDGYKAKDIPFSVGVLDMDWHITRIDPKYGKGWTGYTWNKELFPDPERFLKGLHARGLHTTLNLHPADGVQACEDGYKAVADAMGVDREREEPVIFDFTDPKFVDAYFEHLLHPHEEIGVDFWWIDWQQGRASKIPNMDPLWLLNHYHYLDNSRKRRGLVLSRYGGLGSQRYPAGFSGDTHSTWESLQFQPWFTSTAVNVGFPWWSHDIGGFMQGIRDAELFIRWVQFGVFSPFLRLHSGKRVFNTKEPATFGKEAEQIIGHWLRMRHRLIPYIYTELHRQSCLEGSLIRPLYYDYPDEPAAYQMPNQYFFGRDLMVCPITTPSDAETGLGQVKAWLPDGVFTDIFTGKTYDGGRSLLLHRSQEQIPVLAKPGTILPMAVLEKGDNSTDNPAQLEVIVFPGGDGEYVLFEDDGITDGSAAFRTRLALSANTFTISGDGNRAVLPAQRIWNITFRGFAPFTPKGEQVEQVSYDANTRSTTVRLKPFDPTETVTLDVSGAVREDNRKAKARCRELLMPMRMGVEAKETAYNAILRGDNTAAVLQELMSLELKPQLLAALAEQLS